MQIFDSFEPLTEDQITSFEQEHSLKLPDEYRDFLKQHNGGRPEPASFRYTNPNLEDPTSIVNRLAGINSEHFDTLQKYLIITEGWIHRSLLPIGIDWFGNYICIKLIGEDIGKIYFWHHEEAGEAVHEKNIYFIANGFNEFLNNLYDQE